MIISKTPLRVSLVGGGTDFEDFYSQHNGLVISCAIDKYVYVIVKERFDDLIVLNYTKHEIINEVDEIKHDIIRECMKACGIGKGIEITTMADIPSEGSGLGSSSAITIGLINALTNFTGHLLDERRLAEMACDIEINKLKKPIGKQDQYATAFGGLQNIYFNREGYVPVAPYAKSHHAIADNLFLHYTNVTRKSETILLEQKQNIPNRISQLKKLMSMAYALDRNINVENYDILGDILLDSWQIKKSLAVGVSNPQLDYMIEHSLRSGAMGAKLCGAGGGGFILSYVLPDDHVRFKKGMKAYRELPFKISPYGSTIIFNIL